MIILGKIISIAGKGGVGKTTIAGIIVLELCRWSGTVLAIDADPNYNLGERLGVRVSTTIGSVREQLMKSKDELPAGVSKQELIDYQMRLALQEEECFDLLTMGRQEGPGCYCYINSVLRSFTDALSSKYEYVVIDNEAGLEHLSRRTTIGSDFLLVISDPSVVALKAAGRIARLSNEMELKVKRKVLIINRTNENLDRELLDIPGYSFDAAYRIRNDPLLEPRSGEVSLRASLTQDSLAVSDLRAMINAEIRH